MGVNIVSFVLYGYYISYEKYEMLSKTNDKIEKLTEALSESYYTTLQGDSLKYKNPNIKYIVDGMCGDYIYIGYILAETPDGRYDEMSFDPTEITISELSKLGEELDKFITENQAEVLFDITEEKKIHIFTHYS